jgi:AraC-like DNA-binding protein
VLERRRAVALAQHDRYEEGLSIAQIAGRLGRSPATIKAYFYDPTGENARAVKARYGDRQRRAASSTRVRRRHGSLLLRAGDDYPPSSTAAALSQPREGAVT